MRIIVLLLLLSASGVVDAQSFPARELIVDGIYATRPGTPGDYCLLGANSCILKPLHNAWTDDPLIATWLAAHPKATATPVSSQAWGFSQRPPEAATTYLWIEDESHGDSLGDSLNVALVREGHYLASSMIDMVEAYDRMLGTLSDPKALQYRAQIEQERAKRPEENPHRLISDSDYANNMQRIADAESAAKTMKKGMWSDAGMKGRSPPRDAYLIKIYNDHPDWFARLASLVSADVRITAINYDPKSWATARSAGVAQKSVDEYVGLLGKLDANERLTQVAGAGKAAFIVADILVGAFDNGVMKGYVYSPGDPKPQVNDLDEKWPPGLADAALVYRPIAGSWYLFELHH
jgi:hypothetical protein